jgi:hypothetical protein
VNCDSFDHKFNYIAKQYTKEILEIGIYNLGEGEYVTLKIQKE